MLKLLLQIIPLLAERKWDGVASDTTGLIKGTTRDQTEETEPKPAYKGNRGHVVCWRTELSRCAHIHTA